MIFRVFDHFSGPHSRFSGISKFEIDGELVRQTRLYYVVLAKKVHMTGDVGEWSAEPGKYWYLLKSVTKMIK